MPTASGFDGTGLTALRPEPAHQILARRALLCRSLLTHQFAAAHGTLPRQRKCQTHGGRDRRHFRARCRRMAAAAQLPRQSTRRQIPAQWAFVRRVRISTAAKRELRTGRPASACLFDDGTLLSCMLRFCLRWPIAAVRKRDGSGVGGELRPEGPPSRGPHPKDRNEEKHPKRE